MRASRSRVIALIGFFALVLGVVPALPAAANNTAVVDGFVRAPDGVSVPDAPVRVTISTGYEYQQMFINRTTGAFSFSGLRPFATYVLTLVYTGTSNIVQQMSWNGSPGTSPSFPIFDGERRSFDIRLIAGATVSGTISGAGGAVVPAPKVFLDKEGPLKFVKAADVDPTTGTFTITGLFPGSYQIFGASGGWRWAFSGPELAWGGPSAWEPRYLPGLPGAPWFALAEGATLTGADIVLKRNASIGGTVRLDDGSTLTPHGGTVSATPVLGGAATLVSSDPTTGRYDFYDLTPGSYILCFGDLALYVVSSCYGGDSPATAVPVDVSANEVADGVDGIVTPAGALRGAVMGVIGDTGSAIPNATVRMYRWQGSPGRWILEREVQPGSSGEGIFSAGTLPAGDYIVQALDLSGAFGSKYWPKYSYFAQSEVIELRGGETIDLGTIWLFSRTLDVSRIGGADRFDVGVNVSEELYRVGEVPVAGVPVVYIANGYNFPDALTAGPAAALKGGAVLLVEPTSIPQSVATELTRLRPQRIVVAGGPASVSPAVFEQLKAFVPSPTDVFRANGVDRYEASRAVVRDGFKLGADMAIITTGANFPDALSAGPAAASQGGPVILVDGSASAIDSATGRLLTDLRVKKVYIAGGTGSVSPGIEASLRGLLGATNVKRFAGVDRFEVGVLLSQQFFSSAEYAFVSTGYKFPDALTGGPLAAAYGAPLYLSPPECLAADVAYDILDLDAQAVVLLGGEGSLSRAVYNLQLC